MNGEEAVGFQSEVEVWTAENRRGRCNRRRGPPLQSANC